MLQRLQAAQDLCPHHAHLPLWAILPSSLQLMPALHVRHHHSGLQVSTGHRLLNLVPKRQIPEEYSRRCLGRSQSQRLSQQKRGVERRIGTGNEARVGSGVQACSLRTRATLSYERHREMNGPGKRPGKRRKIENEKRSENEKGNGSGNAKNERGRGRNMLRTRRGKRS